MRASTTRRSRNSSTPWPNTATSSAKRIRRRSDRAWGALSWRPMSPPRPTRPLAIGEHRFDPVLNDLSGPSGTQRLPLKLADLLLRLAREPGQLVRRDTLLDEVWERKHVNEEVLSRA